MTQHIDAYTPRSGASPAWLRVAGEVRRIVKLAAPRATYSAGALMNVAGQLALFADARGVPAAAEKWLTGEMIEAFIASGCPKAAESTRGNYRSRLLRLRVLVLGPDLASGNRQRLAGSQAQAPYTAAQVGRLWECAGAQPTPALRTGIKTLMALGLGCGLDTPEAQQVRAGHVHQDLDTGAILVSVPGARSRVTVCRYTWERVLLEAATALEPGRFLVRPDAETRGKNTVANFLARAHTTPGTPRLSMGRARSTWIVELVDAHIPVTTLIAAAGVDTLHALSRLMPHFAPADPDSARHLLRGRE